MSRLLRGILLLAALSLVACDSGPGPNTAPSVDFSASPSNPRAGTTVNFTANATDPDGEIVAYSWDFNGDGSQDASGPNPSHIFDEQGFYTVTLTVTDDRDETASASNTISIAQQYTEVTITEVEAIDFPFTNEQGQAWDFNSGPDVYFLAVNEAEVLVAESNYILNVGRDDLPLSFPDVDFTISDFSEVHYIGLVDSDNNQDDVIGEASFNVDELGIIGEYPSSFTLVFGENELRLHFDWSE